MQVWQFVVLVFVMVQVSVLCSTVYLHRHVAHKSVNLHPAVAMLMHGWVSGLTGISPKHWMAVHLVHHRYTDMPGDPHSPKQLGMWRVALGSFFFYHKVCKDSAMVKKYSKSYKPDWIDRSKLTWWGLSGCLALTLIFGFKLGLAVWLAHQLCYLFLFSLLNALTHLGENSNGKAGYAINSLWIALWSGGEGWHKNHHQNLSSAKFGQGWRELDIGYTFIWLLAKCRLAAPRTINPVP